MKSHAHKPFGNHVLGLSCVLAIAASSHAIAQDAAGKADRKAALVDDTQPVEQGRTFANKKPEYTGAPTPRSTLTRKGERRSASHSPLPPNPDAKWVCQQTVAEVEPLWRGDKQLTFGFDVMNAGTSTLEIRAKGG